MKRKSILINRSINIQYTIYIYIKYTHLPSIKAICSCLTKRKSITDIKIKLKKMLQIKTDCCTKKKQRIREESREE